MSRRKKRVVTTQEFMERAREAIEAEEKLFSVVEQLFNQLEDILSDGQRQQVDNFLAQVDGKVK